MKKYLVVIVVILIGILFTSVGINTINNSNEISNNTVTDTNLNLSYENNKLRLDVTDSTKEFCIKTTKSKPNINNICFNKINNTAYVSVYTYQRYYLWLKDNNNNISDVIVVDIDNIKK